MVVKKSNAEKLTSSARERIRARLKGGGFDTGGGLGSDAFIKLSDGINFVRILPHKNNAKGGRVDPEKDIFFVERRRHFGAGPSNRSIICPKTNNDKASCPVCDRVETLRNDGEKKEAGQLAARHRYLMNAVLLDKTGKISKKPLILDVGKTIIKAICEYYDDTEEYGDPWGKKLGKAGVSYDFKITRTGSGMKTDYAVQSTQRFKDLANPSDLIASLFDLNELFPVPTTEEAEKMFTGDADDDEDEDKPAKKLSTKKSSPEPDEDDEDSDDDDDDEEEENESDDDSDEESDDEGSDDDEESDEEDGEDEEGAEESDDEESDEEDEESDDDSDEEGEDSDDEDDDNEEDDDASDDESSDDDDESGEEDEESDDEEEAEDSEDDSDEESDDNEDEEDEEEEQPKRKVRVKKSPPKVSKKAPPKKSPSKKSTKKGIDKAALAAKMKSALKKGRK